MHVHLFTCLRWTITTSLPVQAHVCTCAVPRCCPLVAWVCNFAHLPVSQCCHVVVGCASLSIPPYPSVPRKLPHLSTNTRWHENAYSHACHVPAPTRGTPGKPVCMSASSGTSMAWHGHTCPNHSLYGVGVAGLCLKALTVSVLPPLQCEHACFCRCHLVAATRCCQQTCSCICCVSVLPQGSTGIPVFVTIVSPQCRASMQARVFTATTCQHH